MGGIDMKKNSYSTFKKLVDKEDKDQALLFILDLLDNGESIVSVYQNYLIPVLALYECPVKDEEICIWNEHARTSIIRTILESTYQYIIKTKEKEIKKSIITLCPQEEYHEIGAIIVSHYFSLLGFKIFLGSTCFLNFLIFSSLCFPSMLSALPAKYRPVLYARPLYFSAIRITDKERANTKL